MSDEPTNAPAPEGDASPRPTLRTDIEPKESPASAPAAPVAVKQVIPPQGGAFGGGQGGRGGQRDRRGGPGGPGGRGGPGRGGQGGRGRGRRDDRRQEEQDSEFAEKVVHINRCAKVVKGGRRFSFAALVVVGDQKGRVGVGYGKAKEVPECIRKGTERAKKNLVTIELRNETIPHPVVGEHDGGRVMLRPATDGTGVIAGGGVRALLESAGVKNVLSKSLGSNNPGAVVFATLDALRQLRSAGTIRRLRTAE